MDMRNSGIYQSIPDYLEEMIMDQEYHSIPISHMRIIVLWLFMQLFNAVFECGLVLR